MIIGKKWVTRNFYFFYFFFTVTFFFSYNQLFLFKNIFFPKKIGWDLFPKVRFFFKSKGFQELGSHFSSILWRILTFCWIRNLEKFWIICFVSLSVLKNIDDLLTIAFWWSINSAMGKKQVRKHLFFPLQLNLCIFFTFFSWNE
jgi:hypothetical protein